MWALVQRKPDRMSHAWRDALPSTLPTGLLPEVLQLQQTPSSVNVAVSVVSVCSTLADQALQYHTIKAYMSSL